MWKILAFKSTNLVPIGIALYPFLFIPWGYYKLNQIYTYNPKRMNELPYIYHQNMWIPN